MEIASEVQVNIFHWNNLSVTAARCTTLNAKARAKRRLTKTYRRLLTNLIQGIAQTDSGRRLAFTSWSWVNSRY